MQLFERLAATNRWSRVPAGEKLLFALSALALALAIHRPVGHLAMALGLQALLWRGAGIGLRDLAYATSLPLGFALAGAAAQLAVLDLGGTGPLLRLADHELAVATLARSFAGLSALLFLALTTPLGEVLATLRRLGVPAVVLDIALLMLRLVRLAVAGALETRRAQAQRLGYAGFGRSLRSAGALAAALLPRTLERGRRLETGLAVRGYRAGLPLRLRPRRSQPPRLAAGAVALIALAVVAWWRP